MIKKSLSILNNFTFFTILTINEIEESLKNAIANEKNTVSENNLIKSIVEENLLPHYNEHEGFRIKTDDDNDDEYIVKKSACHLSFWSIQKIQSSSVRSGVNAVEWVGDCARLWDALSVADEKINEQLVKI